MVKEDASASERPFVEYYRTFLGDLASDFRRASVGRNGVEVLLARQDAAFPDPAGPDFVLQTVRATPSSFEVEVDVGAGRFKFPGQAGISAMSPPHVDCLYDGLGPFELSLVVLPAPVVARVRSDLGVRGSEPSDFGPMHAGGFFDPTVNDLVHRLWAEASAGNPHGELFSDHLITALVRSLTRRAGYLTALPHLTKPLDARTLSRLIDYVREHLAEDIDLDDLARAAGMGRYEVARAFKATMGQSPWQFVIALRCERAASLLARHGRHASLAFVSAECGFHDQSHLTRHFRRHIGLTPGKYLQSLQG